MIKLSSHRDSKSLSTTFMKKDSCLVFIVMLDQKPVKEDQAVMDMKKLMLRLMQNGELTI